MSSLRTPRAEPFLDDPAAYPEFSILTARQPIQHNLRWWLHRHRTAALVALAACSAKVSGAAAPSSAGVIGDWSTAAGFQAAGFQAAGFQAAGREWRAFLFEGLALDLLVRHFQGLGPALVVMLAMTAAATLVYPFLWLIALRSERPPPMLSALAVLSTAGVPPWALALWGSGHRDCDWGLASGLGVGLLAACLSLKGMSFAKLCWCCRPSSAGGGGGDGGGGALPAALGRSGREERGQGPGRGRPGLLPLTYGEFLFFLLAAPTLVCEPGFLRAGARRRPRALRAASEFSHAVLAFVALHAACSALVAPAMRVIAAFLWSFSPRGGPSSPSPSSFLFCEGGGGGGGGGSSWVNCAGWAAEGGLFSAAAAAGGGGGGGCWLSALLPGAKEDGGGSGVAFFEAFFCGTDGGAEWREVAAAAALGVLVLSPMCHFLPFYAFWHCVCLGLAELTGYPDRFFYGPWWLLSEEPDAMFRLWSTPVHRWLSSCVYRPTAGYGSDGGKEDEEEEEEKKPSRRRRVLGSTATFAFSSAAHEAVTFVAMRRTCWPFNTFCLLFAAALIAAWDSIFPVISDIEISEGSETGGGGGGVVTATENGGTVGENGPPPPATGALPASVALAADGNNGEDSFVIVGGPGLRGDGGGGGGGGGRGGGIGSGKRKTPGSKWRGWGAVAFFAGTACVMGLVVDFLAWQWWRHTFCAD